MPLPSDAHLLAFGRIMHHYGLCEVGFKITISGMLRLDIAHGLVVLQPSSATDLKNVTKSLAKMTLKPKWAEQICCIVGDWSAHNGVRNLIAHSAWTGGDRPGSIKPRNLSIREGRAKFVGDGEDEASYTAMELEAIARSLALINRRTLQFLDDSGLRRLIDEKIDEVSAETSDASGSDTRQSDK